MKKQLVLFLTLLCTLCLCLLSACNTTPGNQDDTHTCTDTDSNGKCDTCGKTMPGKDDQKQNEEEVAVAKEEALASAELAYSAASATLSTEDRFTLNLLYSYTTKQIDMQSGDAKDVKKNADALVKELTDAIAALTKAKTTVEEKIAGALAEIRLLYAAACKTVSSDKAAELTALYEDIRAKFENTEITTDDQIGNIVTDFKAGLCAYVGSLVVLTAEEWKSMALAELDYLIRSMTAAVPYDDVKAKLLDYCNAKKTAIEALTDTEATEALLLRVREDTTEKIKEIVLEKLNELKTAIKHEIDEKIKTAIDLIEDDSFRAELTAFYTEESAKIDAVSDLASAKTTFAEIGVDTETFVREKLDTWLAAFKAKVKTEADEKIKAAITLIEDEALRTKLSGFYAEEAAKMDAVTDVASAKTTAKEIVADTEAFIKETSAEYLRALRTKIKTEIDGKINTLLAKIEDESLRTELTSFYAKESAKIDAISDLQSAKMTAEEIKSDTEAFLKTLAKKQIDKYKTAAKTELDRLYGENVSKIENEEIRATLQETYNNAIAELNKVNSIDTAKTASAKILDDFRDAAAKILKTVIREIADKYKDEVTVIYQNATKPLSAQAKTLLKNVYDRACTDLTAAESVEDVERAVENFKTDAKTYIVAALDAIVAKLGSVPDPWSFLPSSLGVANMVVNAENIPDYTDFVAVSKLPRNYIGKQLNAVYTVLNKMTVALEYVNKVYATFGTVGTVYNTLFDNAEGQNLVLNVGDFTLTLILTEKEYSVSAEIGSVSLLIYADLENENYGAKIQLTETTILKYTVSGSEFVMALDVQDMLVAQVRFVRTGSEVTGYIYETLVAKDKTLTSTSALLTVKDGFTTIVGNKGDFLPTSNGINCEVYENKTGRFVGSEVYEEISDGKFYDTLWYNLWDIAGINSIKKQDKQNGSNADTIWINGATDTIHTKIVGLTNPSRRFDIEFKTVYAFVYNKETKEYESVTFEIPMMFIQEGCVDTFAADFEDRNSKSVESGTVSLLVTEAVSTQIRYGYHTLVETYKVIKTSVTYQSIIDYLKKQ